MLLCNRATLLAQANAHSDCASAIDVSDESIFIYHQAMEGGGDIITEMNDAECFSLTGSPAFDIEAHSTWLTWTASTTGQQVFTIWPEVEEHDIDFVLYELHPDNGCEQKRPVRCMASGDFDFPSPCMGATGLDFRNTDVAERTNCLDDGDNNFLAPIIMTEGTTYALAVNGYYPEHGFSIAFCGTASTPGDAEDCMTLTDMKNFDKGMRLQVFPNPTNGQLEINLPYLSSNDDFLEVYDLLGKQIYSEKLAPQRKNVRLDLSNHTNRIFFLKIRLNNQIFVQQIQKI